MKNQEQKLTHVGTIAEVNIYPKRFAPSILESNRKGRPIVRQLVTGPKAQPRFKELFSLLFEDDTSGILYIGEKKNNQPVLTPCTMCLAERVFESLNTDSDFEGIDYFRLDCRNDQGDSWNSTYYPHGQATVFSQENLH